MITRYQQVYARAVEALGTAEKATRWLAKSNRALDGQAPEALLETEAGMTTVLQILKRIEHGIVG